MNLATVIKASIWTGLALAGLLCLAVCGQWIAAAEAEAAWRRKAESITKGMHLDEALKKLGPSNKEFRSCFQTDDDNAGVTEYHSWRHNEFFLEVGVDKGR